MSNMTDHARIRGHPRGTHASPPAVVLSFGLDPGGIRTARYTRSVMPGRPPTPGKKFVYLDWSTFGEAFDALELSAQPRQRDLSRTVHRLADDTNLCFSFVHVWELAHLQDAAKRTAFARWLDELDLVWIRSDNDVIKSEVLHAVVDAVQGTRTPPPLPTAPSFLSMFEGLDQEALNYGLRHPALADFVELVANEPRLMARLRRFRELSVESAKRFYDDRIFGLKQVTKKQMLATLDGKLRANLEVDVRYAVAQLRRDPASGLHVQRNGMFVSPTDDEVLAAVNGFPDLTVLPYVFLSQTVLRNMSFEILKRPSKNSRAFDDQRGDLFDLAHLVGAAYCDVFTCDKRVARRLADGREKLGFPPPISGRPEVVDRLITAQLK